MISILIFFFIFLFIYNLQDFIEGFPPGERANNPWESPPVGPQPAREDVPPPPLRPPPDAKIKPYKAPNNSKLNNFFKVEKKEK